MEGEWIQKKAAERLVGEDTGAAQRQRSNEDDAKEDIHELKMKVPRKERILGIEV